MVRTLADKDILRRVRLTPYRAGCGPRFTLTTWATHRRDWRGQVGVGYRFVQIDGRKRTIIFEGAGDFFCSPMYAIDSNEAIASLLGFLTLRPGDTDSEYFERDTEVQQRYRREHAETLACESVTRFGQD